MRKCLAIIIAKLVHRLCILAGKQGVTLSGRIALKICPTILSDLQKQVKQKTFVTCGTNGKTTTNNLLYSALKHEGYKVICNSTGSNMLNGVVACFVLAASITGKIDADFAAIEIDEASTLRVFPYFKPDYMILTNLFRDQLDRYGEIDITMDILGKAIDSAPDMEVIVNADDALSFYLIQEHTSRYKTFGVKEQVLKNDDSNEIREGRFCKKCGKKLEYHFYHYSQLGDYYCPHCGFKRPHIDFNASDIQMKNGLSFSINGTPISLHYQGFYNIYNIVAAYGAISSANISLNHFNEMLHEYNPENGRNEKFTINGKEVLLNLAKNPAGFNQNINALMSDEREKDVIIVINDNSQDGTDISWLWDVDFDRLKEQSIHSITVSGIRYLDMALRLKYVDINFYKEENVSKAIEEVLSNGCGNLYVLVNYTALYNTRNILKKMEDK